MFYAITVNSDDEITAKYSGPEKLGTPWVGITQEQYAAIVPASTWSGSAVLAPTAASLTLGEQLAKQAHALIAGGIKVNSIGTPGLNGIYAADAAAQAEMLAVVSYINANGKLPGMAGKLPWCDTAGKAHIFASSKVFMAFYTASLDFVTDCRLVAETGTGVLPEASVDIP